MLKLPPNLQKYTAVILILLLLVNLILFGARKISALLFWMVLGLISVVYFVFFRKKQ